MNQPTFNMDMSLAERNQQVIGFRSLKINFEAIQRLSFIGLLFIFIQLSAFAQVAFPEVISSFGGTAQNASVHLTFTLGEPLYETATNSFSILTQGFNQISSKATDVNELQTTNLTILAYPNPTSNILNLTIHADKFNGCDLLIMDIQGRTLMSQNIKSVHEPINLAAFSAGIYFLKLMDKGKLVKIIKIQKISEI